MKKFKLNFQTMLISFVAIASIGGSMLAVAAPQTAFAADKCSQSFLGFPTWYRGLTDASCDIQSPNSSGGLSNFIWRIALNVVEMAVVAASYLSAFMFLFGGWMFIISQGKPEAAAKARSIMTMSALGLVLTVSAVVFTNFMFTKVLG